MRTWILVLAVVAGCSGAPPVGSDAGAVDAGPPDAGSLPCLYDCTTYFGECKVGECQHGDCKVVSVKQDGESCGPNNALFCTGGVCFDKCGSIGQPCCTGHALPCRTTMVCESDVCECHTDGGCN